MSKSDIEWTDETWNPGKGCEVISPGCANCYAMRIAGRFPLFKEFVTIGKNKRAVWNGYTRLDAHILAQPLHWRKPRKVFVNSMSDLFYEGFTNEEIAAVFGVMAATPHITYQILTKRPQRMAEWLQWVAEHPTPLITIPLSPRLTCRMFADMILNPDPNMARKHSLGTESQPHQWPLPNVWLGTSVENQEYADARIPWLLRCPAAVRFLSLEPLLGPVDLTDVAPDSVFYCDALAGYAKYPIYNRWKKVDWVITGCESGPGYRRADEAWFQSLKEQCQDNGVPFFFKQAMRDGKLVSLPDIDGVQYAEFPRTQEMT